MVIQNRPYEADDQEKWIFFVILNLNLKIHRFSQNFYLDFENYNFM